MGFRWNIPLLKSVPLSVDAIIFLAPISAFDQVLAEDTSVNRLQDSLILWQTVVSNKLLGNVNIILFLNKCDLLKVKPSFIFINLSDLLIFG